MRNPRLRHAGLSLLRKAIGGPLFGWVVLAAAGRPLHAANSVSNVVFSPASPATVSVYPSTTGIPPTNERVNVTFNYTTTDTNGVAVYFGGSFYWYSGVNNKCAYPGGTCSGWFTAYQPGTVTSLTVYMVDWNTNDLNNPIYTATVPVNYTFTSSPPPPPTACVPSATTLCIDDTPGDKRYELKASYATSQGGGSSGPGHAVPTSSLGVTRGGLFWFFSADNPELFVKVLNPCTFDTHHWFFASAGTNVGLTISVKDTQTGIQQTYTNPDVHVLEAIQDQTTFPCP